MTEPQKIVINSLVEEISNGNKDALDRLYRMMYEVLFCFLKNRCKKTDIIEDVINDTFIVIINKSAKINYKNCYSWILSVAYRTMLSNLRKSEKIQDIAPEDVELICDKNCESVEEKCMLSYAIQKLDTLEREIICLRYYVDLTIHDVSRVLRISEPTIKRKLKQIHTKLAGGLYER